MQRPQRQEPEPRGFVVPGPGLAAGVAVEVEEWEVVLQQRMESGSKMPLTDNDMGRALFELEVIYTAVQAQLKGLW